MAEEPRKPRATTPTRFAETTPPQTLPSGDYSYVLEIVLNMQVSMGKVMEAVDSLKSQSKDQGRELTNIGKDVHAAKVVIGVVGFLIAVAATFLGFVMKALIDYLVRAAPK